MSTTTPSDGETDPFRLAEQKRWLDLARLGKEAWNAWAEKELTKIKEDRTIIDLSSIDIKFSSFSGFIVPCDIKFNQSHFNNEIDFSYSLFFGRVDFVGAKFSGSLDFTRSTFYESVLFVSIDFNYMILFSGTYVYRHILFTHCNFADAVYFSFSKVFGTFEIGNSEFNDNINFSYAVVDGDFSLDNVIINKVADFSFSVFKIPPNFLSSSFLRPPVLIGSVFNYPVENGVLGKCSVDDGDARFRRLKQLAVDAHDHELELRLFSLETKAKRFHSLKISTPKHWPGLVLNFVYELTSNFGQSVLRPLGWLLLTIVIALFAFESMRDQPNTIGRGLVDFSSVSKVAALANVFPFAGQAVVGREIMVSGLCPMPETDVGYLDCLTILYTISAVEGVFGLIFLFLIGLGLRNRFRIK